MMPTIRHFDFTSQSGNAPHHRLGAAMPDSPEVVKSCLRSET
jgi:hypothetical protein